MRVVSKVEMGTHVVNYDGFPCREKIYWNLSEDNTVVSMQNGYGTYFPFEKTEKGWRSCQGKYTVKQAQAMGTNFKFL